jgi:hypothetical protein
LLRCCAAAAAAAAAAHQMPKMGTSRHCQLRCSRARPYVSSAEHRKPTALPRFWQAARAPLRLKGTSSNTSSSGACERVCRSGGTRPISTLISVPAYQANSRQAPSNSTGVIR